MFFAISKIIIEADQSTPTDLKELTKLCQKVQAKFKFCAKPLAHTDDKLSFAVALLAPSRNAALQKLDEVIKMAEQSGIGRVDNEISLVDHIDAFEDGDEEEEPAGDIATAVEAFDEPDDKYKLRH